MRALLIRFAGDETATTAIEYGLLTVLVAAAMLAALNTLGQNLNSQMIAIGSGLN